MAAYTKAWLLLVEDGEPGIGYRRGPNDSGFITFRGPPHPDLLELITLLSDEDLRKLQEMRHDIPIARP